MKTALLPTGRRAESFSDDACRDRLQAAANNTDWAKVQAPGLTVSYSKQST
jgi:hypothetical protein